MFVGYCKDVKAYRLFDPDSREVLFQRDVQFDESLPVVTTLPLAPTSLPILLPLFQIIFRMMRMMILVIPI